MNFQQFKSGILKNNEKRVSKIYNSYGVYDYFKYYRKVKPKDKRYIITEKVYYKILRSVYSKLAQYLSEGQEIILPCRMGTIEIRKIPIIPKIDSDGKLTYKAPINWEETLKLWYEDQEAYENKTLVKRDIREKYKIFYNKYTANYKNKSYYMFTPNREIKKALSKAILNNKIEAYSI